MSPASAESNNDKPPVTVSPVRAALIVELMKTHCKKGIKIAYSILRDKNLAPDIASNTILKLLEMKEELFSKIKRLDVYFFEMVRNEAFYVQNKKCKFCPILDNFDSNGDDEDTLLHKYFANIDTIEPLEELIYQLKNPRYSEILYLYYIEHLPHKEIAKIMNISENNSKAILKRAKNALRVLFNSRYPDDDPGGSNGKSSHSEKDNAKTNNFNSVKTADKGTSSHIQDVKGLMYNFMLNEIILEIEAEQGYKYMVEDIGTEIDVELFLDLKEKEMLEKIYSFPHFLSKDDKVIETENCGNNPNKKNPLIKESFPGVELAQQLSKGWSLVLVKSRLNLIVNWMIPAIHYPTLIEPFFHINTSKLSTDESGYSIYSEKSFAKIFSHLLLLENFIDHEQKKEQLVINQNLINHQTGSDVLNSGPKIFIKLLEPDFDISNECDKWKVEGDFKKIPLSSIYFSTKEKIFNIWNRNNDDSSFNALQGECNENSIRFNRISGKISPSALSDVHLEAPDTGTNFITPIFLNTAINDNFDWGSYPDAGAFTKCGQIEEFLADTLVLRESIESLNQDIKYLKNQLNFSWSTLGRLEIILEYPGIETVRTFRLLPDTLDNDLLFRYRTIFSALEIKERGIFVFLNTPDVGPAITDTSEVNLIILFINIEELQSKYFSLISRDKNGKTFLIEKCLNE